MRGVAAVTMRRIELRVKDKTATWWKELRERNSPYEWKHPGLKRRARRMVLRFMFPSLAVGVVSGLLTLVNNPTVVACAELSGLGAIAVFLASFGFLLGLEGADKELSSKEN